MAQIVTDIPKLTARPLDGHKGLFGKVLIVGGSSQMAGAAALAGLAALRSGAGLVRIAVPKSIQQTVAGLVPCATTVALAEDAAGRIDSAAIGPILDISVENDCLAIGPGLGQSVALQGIIRQVIGDYGGPLVIDADGLNNLAACWDEQMQLGPKTILAPHPGEFSRLFSAMSRESIPTNRTDQAEQLSAQCGGIMVLKGASTVVTDSERTYINTTGNPGMATGGAGDVLTGIICGLAAGGLPPFEAAVLAAYIHGKAGDLAAEALGQTALIATDIIDHLGEAFKTQSQ